MIKLHGMKNINISVCKYRFHNFDLLLLVSCSVPSQQQSTVLNFVEL
jgi:hypothetical protein